VPVLAGCGYGTRTASEFARAAENARADGLLLFPPYLANAEPSGLVAQVQAVCASTKLGVIFYNRDNAVLNESALEQLCDRCPNLVGFKDRHGDIELITRICARSGDRLVYIGGLPTAETYALPYQETGVTTYSSAIFNSFRASRRISTMPSGAAIALHSLRCRAKSSYPISPFGIAAETGPLPAANE
jgi:5-dehydro-4-deoxyglucarate dehydratase